METAVDKLIRLGQQARLIENITPDKKARRLAGIAVKHATAGIQSHNEGHFDGANESANQASQYLTDAARLHVATLEPTEAPPAEVLDVSHLGSAKTTHQEYADQINEGKNNGR